MVLQVKVGNVKIVSKVLKKLFGSRSRSGKVGNECYYAGEKI
jgi:hypothetical protein